VASQHHLHQPLFGKFGVNWVGFERVNRHHRAGVTSGRDLAGDLGHDRVGLFIRQLHPLIKHAAQLGEHDVCRMLDLTRRLIDLPEGGKAFDDIRSRPSRRRPSASAAATPRIRQARCSSLASSPRCGLSNTEESVTPMTEQLALPLELEITNEAELTTPAAVQTPFLITEAEVALSTAAAVGLRPAIKDRPTLLGRIALGVRRTFATSEIDERPKPRHHPKRLRYLDDARMEREMHRL
jgi:hypothetical protein